MDDSKVIYIKDFFRKSRLEQETVNEVIEYSLYEITDGDRADTVVHKIYGDSDLHWTFFLVNDYNNYYDWHKDFMTFEKYMDKKYIKDNMQLTVNHLIL